MESRLIKFKEFLARNFAEILFCGELFWEFKHNGRTRTKGRNTQGQNIIKNYVKIAKDFEANVARPFPDYEFCNGNTYVEWSLDGEHMLEYWTREKNWEGYFGALYRLHDSLIWKIEDIAKKHNIAVWDFEKAIKERTRERVRAYLASKPKLSKPRKLNTLNKVKEVRKCHG